MNEARLYTTLNAPAGLVDMICQRGRGLRARTHACGGDPQCSHICHSVCNATCVACVINREKTAITLKRSPRWWFQATDLHHCKSLAKEIGPRARHEWEARFCDDYVCDRPSFRRHNGVIVDVGMHDGQDTIYWLFRGFRVVAIDANVERAVLSRPLIALALRTGQLTILHAIVSTADAPPSAIFYRHKTASELSTMFVAPTERHLFDPMVIKTTTCARIIQQFGAPLYLKIDIEGADGACIHSLSNQSGRPLYVSTEDPLLLSALQQMGYRRFKLIPQHVHRAHGQFSGGWPETIGGSWAKASDIRRHPFFHVDHMHERVLPNGQRVRSEHDLHARMW